MAKKIRVAVLMGGPSSEHDVSLKSGRMVVQGLDNQKYIAKPIVISRKGKWPISPKNLAEKFDVAFIAMHGEYGEDGQVQKILKKVKMPYTGSDSKASAIGIDKIRSARRFVKAGLLVPEFKLISSQKVSIKAPFVVKPADRGSSVGVTIVDGSTNSLQKEFTAAVKLAKKYSERVMVQKFIRGREMTCGVLEINGKPQPLVPTEIIPKKGGFFDFEAKYKKGASEEITPPRISARLINELKKSALAAHKAIGARGVSRTDFIIEEGGKQKDKNCKIYVLEINTLPGMTPTSLLPQEAKAAGISFSRMLDHIIEAALRYN